ncbi:hypothetical protein BH09MYX1_BH09MYX1_23830 [soil metagenome]
MSQFGTKTRPVALALCATVAIFAASCGARTGLLAPELDASLADAGDDAAAVTCHPGSFTLAKARPAVMLVVDRSGSMNTRFSNAGSRWVVLGNALAKALPPADATMQLGLLMFPQAGSSRNDVSCGLPGSVNLLPALHNAQPLLTQLKATNAGGATPTADAIALAGKAILGVRSAKSARAMVLATDGGPNCNSGLDPRTCVCADLGQNCKRDGALCLDDQRTSSRIAGFYTSGVPTYVIGIGSDASASVLDAMAVAGGRPQTGAAHKYYGVTSESELDSALVTIRDQVGVCTYLTTSVPDETGTIRLLVDGKAIPYDKDDGWVFVDRRNGEIVLAGAACKLVTNSPLNVVAEVSCGDEDAGDDADAADARDAQDAQDGNDAASNLDGSTIDP